MPLSIMVKPASGACNMRCGYCFYADELARREAGIHPSMNLHTMEKVIRRAFAFGTDAIHFVFQGGEPTLAGLPFFQGAVTLQRQYNTRGMPVRNSIQTNGYALTPAWVDFFRANDFLVGLSLDGCKSAHDAHRRDGANQGTFDRVMATADALHAGGIPCNILAVVTDAMVQHQTETLETLSRFGYVQLIPCMEGLDGSSGALPRLSSEGWADFLHAAWQLYRNAAVSPAPMSIRIFDNFLRILRGEMPDTCAMAGRCAGQFMVESNGDVYPCDFYGVDGWKLGNIGQQNFRTMAQSRQADDFLRRSLPIPADCRTCPCYPLCRNGCMRDREESTGLYRWCDSMKRFLSRHGTEMRQLAQVFDPNGRRRERRDVETRK